MPGLACMILFMPENLDRLRVFRLSHATFWIVSFLLTCEAEKYHDLSSRSFSKDLLEFCVEPLKHFLQSQKLQNAWESVKEAATDEFRVPLLNPNACQIISHMKPPEEAKPYDVLRAAYGRLLKRGKSYKKPLTPSTKVDDGQHFRIAEVQAFLFCNANI